MYLFCRTSTWVLSGDSPLVDDVGLNLQNWFCTWKTHLFRYSRSPRKRQSTQKSSCFKWISLDCIVGYQNLHNFPSNLNEMTAIFQSTFCSIFFWMETGWSTLSKVVNTNEDMIFEIWQALIRQKKTLIDDDVASNEYCNKSCTSSSICHSQQLYRFYYEKNRRPHQCFST